MQISINGAKPPKKAFDFSIKKLKKYTTNNVIIHKSINLTIEESKINKFIHNYGHSRGMDYLNDKNKGILKEALETLPKNDTSFIMIYTPKLSSLNNPNKRSRGIAFYNSYDYKVVAYNQTSISDAPVITDIQSWKIVLTHELGHHFGVPAQNTHNKAGHCTSRECIMYSKPDWQSVVSVIFKGMPYDFCKLCKEELQEAKNRCGAIAI